MKKRMLSLLLAVCLVVSMAPAAFAANGTTTAADTEKATTATEQGAKLYSDVPEDSWYVESVDTVTKNGYFNGYPDGTFKPSEAMTRAMFVTVISRMAEAETDNSVTNFPDVPVDTWYTGAVTWANENGIVLGRSDTVFDPDTAISRIEMCIIISRYVKYLAAETGKTLEASKDEKTFTDTAELSESYMDALKNCVAYGLIQGYADGTFKPTKGATRAEVATVVARLAAKLEEKKPTPPSVPSGTYPTQPTEYTVTYTAEVNGQTYSYTLPDKVAKGEQTDIITWKVFAENSKAPKEEELSISELAFADWEFKGTTYSAGDKLTVNETVELTAKFVKTTDLLFIAMQKAEQKAKGWFAEKHGKVSEDASAALTYGDVTLDRVAVTGTDQDDKTVTRNIYVDGSASIQGLTMENKIVEIAAQVASGALGGEDAKDVSYYRSQLSDLVRDVADAIDATIDGNGVRAIVDSLYTWGGQQARDEILKGCGLTDAISSMTVKVENQSASATITVDGNHGLTLSGDKKTVAKNLGVALAKELYKSAQENTPTYSSDVNMDATIELTFTTKNLDNYPSKYNVVVALTLSDEGKVLSYQHKNDTDYIKVTIPTSVQDNYSAQIDDVVKGVMTSTALTSKIDDVTKSLTNADAFTNMVTALQGLKVENADTTVSTAVTNWVGTNFKTANAEDNPLYKVYWQGNGELTAARLDNKELYGTAYTSDALVQTIAEAAADYFKDEVDKTLAGLDDSDFIESAIKSAINNDVLPFMKPVADKGDTNGVEDVIASIAKRTGSEAINIEMLKDLNPDIKNYVYAAICDKVQSGANWRYQYYPYMTAAVISLIDTELDEHLGATDGTGKLLTDLSNLNSIKSISELPVEKLLETLKSVRDLASTGGGDGGDDDLLQKYGESIINYIQRGANALANRQVTVTITLNTSTGIVTKELTPDELHTLATEKITVLTMLFSNIEGDSGLNLGGRSLSDFAPRTDGTDFCTITIKTANSNTPIKVVPVIEILAQ